MTDAVEGMARAAAEAAHRMPWSNIPAMGQEQWCAVMRAAIRDLREAGGLVVARMPDDLPMMRTPEGYALVRGHNAALAAVRAAAVDVE